MNDNQPDWVNDDPPAVLLNGNVIERGIEWHPERFTTAMEHDAVPLFPRGDWRGLTSEQQEALREMHEAADSPAPEGSISMAAISILHAFTIPVPPPDTSSWEVTGAPNAVHDDMEQHYAENHANDLRRRCFALIRR